MKKEVARSHEQPPFSLIVRRLKPSVFLKDFLPTTKAVGSGFLIYLEPLA